ncbi:MAG TPA: hypothetical protein EYG69_04670 [Campylobacterales bacterium]|nr:hypothetical protein [Campylobacterales bacterium]
MNEELKDIKGLVEIPDISFIVFVLVVGFVLIILSTLIYLFIKGKRGKKATKKQIMLQSLKTLDFSDAKNSAYIFTKNCHLFLDETNQKRYNDICDKLEIYKYKKDIPLMDKYTKQEMIEFISELHDK